MERGADGLCHRAFWASRLLVVISCVLLIYSFVVIDVIDGSKQSTVSLAHSSPSPRLVFMVIDAFRLSFLTSPNSPMTFSRSSISSQNAKLFDAYARMPTVTLPRITAYITGTLPSFGTILTNLATEEIKVGNWITRLKSNGKHVHFFGDDTWIRLLPGQFEKSEGVTSFYVNDFTEVDNNVTRHLNEELASGEWDALILHYLGLDHIGHSLGGTSSKIDEKLVEMDGVIKRLYEEMEKTSTETYLIVCGDHGMTPFGSHGGASPDETRVPAIIWKINGQNEGKKSPVPIDQDALKIEQIDISATIFDIFGMPPPPESYGISLFGIVGSDTDKTIRRQHEHFKNLVKVKQLPISDVCEGECDFSNRFIQSALKKWFREVQEKLIGSASEVPNFSLFTCIFILTIAISISVWTSPPSEWTDALIFLFNVTCFASSLIEEEHEIWYFLASTLIVLRIVVNLRYKSRREKIIHWIILGVLHRISFGYVQSTRRRWSMDPNLLPPDVFPNSLDIKVDDLNGYFSENALLVTFISLVLWITVDKNYLIIFPLISHSLRIMGYSLFDAYFLTIFRLSILPYFYFFRDGKWVIPLVLTVVPHSQLPLIFFIYQIGVISSKLQMTHAEVVILCTSSFFYTGNSNSLSTLSLTSAYVGLLDYYPVLVGFQLVLNTFAGPIAFLVGRKASSAHGASEFLNLHFSFRISSFITSLIGLYIFQHHLFVWSVYSPKVVYDMAHVIFFSIM